MHTVRTVTPHRNQCETEKRENINHIYADLHFESANDPPTV